MESLGGPPEKPKLTRRAFLGGAAAAAAVGTPRIDALASNNAPPGIDEDLTGYVFARYMSAEGGALRELIKKRATFECSDSARISFDAFEEEWARTVDALLLRLDAKRIPELVEETAAAVKKYRDATMLPEPGTVLDPFRMPLGIESPPYAIWKVYNNAGGVFEAVIAGEESYERFLKACARMRSVLHVHRYRTHEAYMTFSLLASPKNAPPESDDPAIRRG